LALVSTAEGITLTFQGASTRYIQADVVPKIFLTPELHDGDFAHDATLSGGNAIARADAFCNQSAGRADGQSYKAVLVDGSYRGASPAVDWVLKPLTTYFQAAGALPMFTSNALARHDSGLFTNGYLSGYSNIEYMWTGLQSDFTLATNNCQGWSSLASGLLGSPADVRGSFGYAVVAACTIRYGLICVSQ
jgi:hypothetical protein